MTTPSGIDGVFVSVSTRVQGSLEQPVITSQSIRFRVYHRRPDGYETWGWYGDDRVTRTVLRSSQIAARSDDRAIRQNRQAAEKLLKELGVEIDWLPSA